MMIKSGDFATLIGVSKQQVNNYRAEGMPSVKKGSYYYYTFDAIEWLYETGKRELSVSSEEEGLSIPLRKTLIETKLKELEYDKKRGKLMSADIAKKNGAEAGLFVRDTLSSMPDRFIPRLRFSEEDKHYLRNELKQEVYDTLITISNFASSSKKK